MPEKVRWGPAGERGRGLFATVPIRAGEEITRAPVVVIEAGALTGTPLEAYCFDWSDHEEAVAFGPIQMANHSTRPNSELSSEGLDLIMIAIADIAPGEEIVYDYDCELWFEDATGTAEKPATETSGAR